jgi:hypothetical protein
MKDYCNVCLIEIRQNQIVPIPILPPKYANRIYYISHLTLVSIFTSFYLKLYNFSFLTTLVLMTSLNYLKYPIKNWRRTLDMFVVFITFLYTMFYSQYSNIYNRNIYYLSNLIGIVCYFLAKKNECKHKSSLYHCGIHIVSNVGNISLYIGLSK